MKRNLLTSIVATIMLLAGCVQAEADYIIYFNFQGWWEANNACIKRPKSEGSDDWDYYSVISLGNNWFYYSMPDWCTSFNIVRGSTSEKWNETYVTDGQRIYYCVGKNEGDNYWVETSKTTDWTAGWENTEQKPWIKFNVSDGDKSGEVHNGDLQLGTTNKLYLKEFGSWTWKKKDNGNVANIGLNYRICSSENTSGSFTTIEQNTVKDENDGNGSGNIYQKWMWEGDTDISLKSLSSGNYYVEFYYTSKVNRAVKSTTCPETIYYSNNGSNYKALFTIPKPVVEAKTGSYKAGTSSTVTVGPKSGTTVTGQSFQYMFEYSTDSGSSWTVGQAYSSTDSYSYTINNPSTDRVRVTMKVTETGEESEAVELPMQYVIYVEDARSWGKMYLHENQASGGSDYNAAWPGVALPVAFTSGTSTYYEVTLDTYYKRFWLNDGTSTNQTFNSGICNNYTDNSTQKFTPANHGQIWYVYTDDNANNCYLKQKEDINPYRLKSTASGSVFYSNILTSNGTFSLWCKQGGTLNLEKLANGTWTEQSATITSTGVTEDNVYTATFNGSNQVSDFAKYTDEYYLYGTTAGKDRHAAIDINEEDKSAAAFTYFAPNPLYPNETYSYYWVDWVTVGQDVRCTVGNKYNHNLATVLGADQYTGQAGTVAKRPEGLTGDIEGANVRFTYEPKTNAFTRTLIYGSTAGVAFLTLHTTNNLVYNETEEGNMSEQVIDEDHKIELSDLSNWQYQVDVWAKKESSNTPEIVLKATYNNQNQYPFGVDDSSQPIKAYALGTQTTAGCYHVRLIYDYKTNRIVIGWLPSANQSISSEFNLNANMIIMRTENNDAAQLTMANSNAKVTDVHQIYTVLEVESDKKNGTGWTSAHNGGFYWMSLPYDCAIRDIFGLEGDYKNKWEIQVYRGDLRAKYGYWDDSPSYWRVPNFNDTIPAGYGFVVRFKIDYSDFKAVEDANGQKKYRLSLFFPSVQNQTSQIIQQSDKTKVDEYECKIERDDRKHKDSNWSVVGVPAMQNLTINTTGITEDSYIHNPDYNGSNTSKAPNFYYAWDYNSGSPRYTPTSASDATFHSTFGYMVQYAGDITWSSSYSGNKKNIVARREQAEPQAYRQAELTLSALSPDADGRELTDRTYLTMVNGATTAYDLNLDLGKVMNANFMNIYSLGAYVSAPDANGQIADTHSEFAAYSVPVEDCTIPLGVQAANGDYKIALSNRDLVNGMSVILYDRAEDRLHDLLFSDYQFTLSANSAYVENRFEVRLGVTAPSKTTDMDETKSAAESAYGITQVGDELIIRGIDTAAMVRLFDSTGKVHFSGVVREGQAISAPAAGMYVLQVAGDATRIVVR